MNNYYHMASSQTDRRRMLFIFFQRLHVQCFYRAAVRSFIVKLFIAVSLLATQVACTATTLPPYEATYTTKLRGIKISGTRTFEQTSDNHYRVSWKAKALWMRLNEWSEFEIINDQVRPLSYHYTRKGLGTDRPIHVYFDWENMQVNGSKGKKDYQFALQPNAQDKLSYQVQMQLDLLANPDTKAVNYTVAAYNGLKQYQFEYQHNDKVETKLGSRESLLFERYKKDKTIKVWVAPEHYYLPVKVEQIEGDSNNVLLIKSWQSDAKAYVQNRVSAKSNAPKAHHLVGNEPSILDDDF